MNIMITCLGAVQQPPVQRVGNDNVSPRDTRLLGTFEASRIDVVKNALPYLVWQLGPNVRIHHAYDRNQMSSFVFVALLDRGQKKCTDCFLQCRVF